MIVDPFGSPTIGHDPRGFDEGMGPPNPPHFRIIQPTGVGTLNASKFVPALATAVWARK